VTSMQAIVSDGISMGRPCCQMFWCCEPLQNNRHQYCHTHFDNHYNCIIEGCSEHVHVLEQTLPDGTTNTKVMKTCSNPVHISIEKHSQERSTGSFLFKEPLKKAHAQPLESLSTSSQISSQDMEEEVE
ncbi:hypothetical protein FA15DRAFT_570114, partial [Coprinopsis marcescibilis]